MYYWYVPLTLKLKNGDRSFSLLPHISCNPLVSHMCSVALMLSCSSVLLYIFV